MKETIHLSHVDRQVRGHISLTGSKSISNRALIIQALTPGGFGIDRLAAANDTVRLQQLLGSQDTVYDAGPAGTTFRFLTAYLSLQSGEQILTGSDRMKQRPIGVLVTALRTLGAQIDYLEQDGYPPLRIGAAALHHTNELTIAADTSSQYISALLLIAPTLPNGLVLHLDGEIVSRPYIEMTLSLMGYFGAQYQWDDSTIRVAAQGYQSRPFTVEADWSAASYYYSLAALADVADLQIDGLFKDSLQGDAVVQEVYRSFGVDTAYTQTGIRLTKRPQPVPPVLEYDFLKCPDIAQTVAVTCAGLGVAAVFTGLQTLKIKETDRIAALRQELAKVGVSLAKLPPRFSKQRPGEFYMLEGQAQWETSPVFDTYEDHRMAMALAPLAVLGSIGIHEPMVVGKSYPAFWEDWQQLGFRID